MRLKFGAIKRSDSSKIVDLQTDPFVALGNASGLTGALPSGSSADGASNQYNNPWPPPPPQQQDNALA
jgi:hypothetical protein